MDVLRQLSKEQFISLFSNIVEHNSEVAEKLLDVFEQRQMTTLTEFLSSLDQILHNLPDNKKRAVLTSHPDLAGKLADKSLLTPESTREQAAAGLNLLTSQQKENICQLNNNYREKFGFPFVVCARQNKVDAILTGLGERIENSEGLELERGIAEVVKIASLRATDIVNNLQQKCKY